MMFPHSVTILRAVKETDRYGGQTPTSWEVVGTVEGFYQPKPSSEELTIGDIQIGDGVVFLPAGTDITGSDRIQLAGVDPTVGSTSGVWEIVGPPNVWDAKLSVDHTRIVIRRVEVRA